MPTDPVLYALADAGVATITLNDPDTRNALSAELLAGPDRGVRTRPRRRARCAAWCSRPRTRRSFSSGANLGGFAGDVPLVHKHFGSERFVELFKLIGALGKPTVCAADGHVLAGALGIALACDLIVASEKATFGTPEINVGAFPFMIMALIYRNVPRKKANELLLLGERWSAQEALAAGIVNKVVPAEDFDAAVADWAQKLAGKSPVIMRLGKEAMRRQLDMPLRRRARLPARAAHAGALDRGHRRGRHRVLREARPAMERPLMRPESSAGTPPVSETERPSSLLRPLVEDLEARRAKISARRRRGEDRTSSTSAKSSPRASGSPC